MPGRACVGGGSLRRRRGQPLLDTLPRPFLTRGGRGASRFRACGVTGFYVALAVRLPAASSLTARCSCWPCWRCPRDSRSSATKKELTSLPVLKMTYQQQTKTVLYRSKMNPVLKKNFAVFPVLDWIATLTTHIPNKGEHLIRYYGYYSNVSRGKRKREKPEDKTEISETMPRRYPRN